MAKKSLWSSLHQILLKALPENTEVAESALPLNIRRLHAVSIAGFPVSLIYVLIFSFFPPEQTSGEQLWQTLILFAHAGFALCMLLLFIASSILRKKPVYITGIRIVQGISLSIILLMGILLSGIDQLVTTNITPFIIVCTVAGIIFLLPPVVSLPVFSLSYLAFFLTLGFFSSEPTVLSSNLINGFTAVGIGFVLSVIGWGNHVRNHRQREQIMSQQKDLEIKNNLLSYLASSDCMTGLLNRREFETKAQLVSEAMKEKGGASCLIITDIDDFKDINTTHGHPGGDEVIIEASKVLSAVLRGTDILGRWGGEEFIILLPDTTMDRGKFIAERLRKAMEDKVFFINKNSVRITASFGITLYPGDATFDSCYNKADQALFKAKDNGKNRVDVAD
ncbi:MAG: GGDEF domain-containing protein [Clostridia bacterium]